MLIKILSKIVEVSIYCLIFIIPFSKSGIEIFATVAIVAWLVKQAVSCKAKIGRYLPKTPATGPVLALFAVYFISAILSADIRLSMEGVFFKLAEYIMIFFVCADMFSCGDKREKRLIAVFGAVILSAILLFADAGFQWIYGKDLIRGYRLDKLKACFTSSNGFAGYIIVVLPVLLCAFFLKFRNRRISRERYGALFLYFTGVILLGKTDSRGAWLGYLLSMVFLAVAAWFTVMDKTRGLKRQAVLIILCVIIPLMTAVIFVKPVRERLSGIGSGFTSSVSRFHMWREAVSIIEDFPVLGTGPNTYTKVIPKYSVSGVTGSYPHNCYLQMAAETGIAGLAVFLWIICRFFYAGLKSIRRHAPRDDVGQNLKIFLLGSMAGVLATLVQSFFDTNLFMLQLAALFWTMLGVGTALIERGS